MKESEWKVDPAEHSPARVNPVLTHRAERRHSLDGKWMFRLDPDDEGVKRGWFRRPASLKDSVNVPGCWQGQGHGHDGDDYIWDFRMETRTFRATYKGTGWYGKMFRVPGELRGRKLWLNFGGVHPSADVWVNGKKVGSHSAPFVPFAFDVTDVVRFGGENFLAVRVHEAHRYLGLAYGWQGNWSGLYRSVELTATGEAWLERLWIYPDVRGERLRIVGSVGGDDVPLTLSISAAPVRGKTVVRHDVVMDGPGGFAFALPITSPGLWSPDEPNLYRVDAVLRSGRAVLDAASERVGFLELSTKGKHFLINGEPYYMRGTGDFVANPETASPDTDRARWRKKLKTLRDYGYNYVRCQSYVPTPEYYDVADEVGLIIQSEPGMLGPWGR